MTVFPLIWAFLFDWFPLPLRICFFFFVVVAVIVLVLRLVALILDAIPFL